MHLRLDHLLRELRERPAAILEAIDRDPLLVKRASGPLVLANASQALYTPQAQHQLYAKGIVYRCHPYCLVSLPLVKIYNLGECDITTAGLAALAGEPGVRLRFLRKIDGSLIQVFRHEGRNWFTTRGTLDGAVPGDGSEDEFGFDHVGAARRIAAERYPRLLDDAGLLDGRTLVFELLHPAAPKVTNYGGRADLVLLAGLDTRRLAYLTHSQVAALAEAYGLAVVDELSPPGDTLPEQIDGLLTSLAGTDEEGCVLQFEQSGEVVHRVKVKSPDYLRRTRTMAECTYERLAALLEANPQARSWPDVKPLLKAQGCEAVPEEVLDFYRRHYERFTAYLAECTRLCDWAAGVCAILERQLSGHGERDEAAYRRAFAALAAAYPLNNLLFAALDGRLDPVRIRKVIRTPEEARRALLALEGAPSSGHSGVRGA